MGRFFRFRVYGQVQGVGFRPRVFREAEKLGLSGFVRNAGSHAEIVADDKDAVLSILKHLPPRAHVSRSDIEEISAEYSGFHILESSIEAKGFGGGIPPDTATCNDCLHELRDKKNRRHGYFFITCTSCGPRFSITESLPYDRKSTSMSHFGMCDACGKEYITPQDRRFHAETIACDKCGPSLSIYVDGKKADAQDPIKEAARLLLLGKIVALKGIGGFHLACIAEKEPVANLREITGRPDKPFALMVRDVGMAKKIAYVSAEEEKCLSSPARPILVLKKKADMPHVSELDTLGIMLPYTALHYLLFDFISEPLVMTSANMPDAPITAHMSEQFAAVVLDHNRPISNRADDSVMKSIAGKFLFARRSRGFVPEPIDISVDGPVLALGADSMNTFCLAKDGKAVLSEHIGALSNPETFARYRNEVDRFLAFYNFVPEKIICDLHPEYNSSAFAKELAEKFSAKLVRVQHHFAHAASCAEEHGLSDYVGIACDGAGYGTDGTIWGGEVVAGKERIGHLEEQAMPGGDSAVVYPEKMLFGILRNFMDLKEISLLAKIPQEECEVLGRQVAERFNCPATTSAGRVLDAASALLGFCHVRTYDGRPAMLLEANSTKPLEFSPKIRKNVLLTTPLFEYLVENIDKEKGALAATAQKYIAEGLYKIASSCKKPVVFSGGCAYNRIMAEFLVPHGVFVNEKVPAGDGGISFGQVAASKDIII